MVKPELLYCIGVNGNATTSILLIHYVDDQIHPYMFNQVLFDMNMYIML
jgi:hypothetical protein